MVLLHIIIVLKLIHVLFNRASSGLLVLYAHGYLLWYVCASLFVSCHLSSVSLNGTSMLRLRLDRILHNSITMFSLYPDGQQLTLLLPLFDIVTTLSAFSHSLAPQLLVLAIRKRIHTVLGEEVLKLIMYFFTQPCISQATAIVYL